MTGEVLRRALPGPLYGDLVWDVAGQHMTSLFFLSGTDRRLLSTSSTHPPRPLRLTRLLALWDSRGDHWR